MTERTTIGNPDNTETPTAEYEAPRVESVVTADELDREAVFGGGISMQG